MKRPLVAIPVFNERGYVSRVVEEVRKHVSEILVVDDGSTDGTTEVIGGMSAIHRIFHPQNRGYGEALASSFRYAIEGGYDWLITMDCDEQHEPSFIPRFVEAARGDHADIISGSRYLAAEQQYGRPPADRRRINRQITRLLNELLGLSLTDAFCGFKAYRTAELGKLSIDVAGYAMPLQLWVQAADRGLRISEIPVRLIYKDPDRHFGGQLDDPEHRLAYYLRVLRREMEKTSLNQRCDRIDELAATVCP